MKKCLYIAIFFMVLSFGCVFPASSQPEKLLGDVQVSGVLNLLRPERINRSFGSTKAPNALLFGASNAIAFCPTLSCVLDEDQVHQRTSALFSSSTQVDGGSEEQTVAITTLIDKGITKQWQPGTRFEIGDNVAFGGERNSVYRVVQAGISDHAGLGPKGKGRQIIDGTVIWDWINDSAINAKAGLYNEVANVKGGGASWAQANNFQMLPGHIPTYNVNTELDFVNNSGSNCTIGISNCIGLMISMTGSNKSTDALTLSSDNTNSFSTVWGLRLSGKYLASDSDIEDDSEAPVGLGFGVSGIGGQNHSVATVQDASKSPSSIQILGSHSMGAFVDQSDSATTLKSLGHKENAEVSLEANAPKGIFMTGELTEGGIVDETQGPVFLSITGRHDNASISDISISGIGLLLNGTYGQFQIAGKGFSVDPSGTLNTRGVTLPLSENGDITVRIDNANHAALFQATSPSFSNIPVSDNKMGGNFVFDTGLVVKKRAVFQNVISTEARFQSSLFTPKSSSAACAIGEFVDDQEYHYVCVSKNLWKRVRLETF